MQKSRKLAGILMVASGVTHTSELFVFGWGLIMAIVLGFGAAFFVIGIFLLRDGEKVLWWGTILPSIAIVLGIANSVRSGYFHPYTIWHLAVDFTVVPICAYHLMRRSTSAPAV
jgi:hypothetical protein